MAPQKTAAQAAPTPAPAPEVAPEAEDVAAVTVTVLLGTVHTGKGTFGPGSEVALDADDAERLAGLGLVKRVAE